MGHLFMYLISAYSYTVPQAMIITFAVFLGLVVISSIVWYAACNYSTRVNVWTWKVLATMAAVIMSADILTDHDDDPVMPAEYVGWASAKAWRESCIRSDERRM